MQSKTEENEKSKLESHRSRLLTPAPFWDSLSKVWLTRPALKEFDRRTAAKELHRRRTAQSSHLSIGLHGLLGQEKEINSVDIKYFAKHGGPDLSDLRGWPPPSGAHVDPAMSLTPSNSSTKDEHAIRLTINKSSAYDRNFGQHLIDHGIYPKDHCPPEDEDRRASRPSNEKEIRDRLARPRPSFSHISDDAFFKFTSSEAQAPNEATMILKSFPVILGDANIPSSANLLFNNLKPLTDGTLVAAKPDFCDGARPERIDPRIREELASYITPSTQWRAPVLPNLFIEAKSQQGSEAVVTCQAQYDGALGARGIHQLRSFGARALPVYDNKAYTITATYYNGHLRLYTSHPTPPVGPGRDSEYRMTQVGGWDLTDSVERFCLGVGAFRNARDWAKEQRDRIIEATNARLKISGPSGDISAQRSAPLESNPSNNELTGDIIGNDATSHRHPKRKSEKGHQERKAKRRRS